MLVIHLISTFFSLLLHLPTERLEVVTQVVLVPAVQVHQQQRDGIEPHLEPQQALVREIAEPGLLHPPELLGRRGLLLGEVLGDGPGVPVAGAEGGGRAAVRAREDDREAGTVVERRGGGGVSEEVVVGALLEEAEHVEVVGPDEDLGTKENTKCFLVHAELENPKSQSCEDL